MKKLLLLLFVPFLSLPTYATHLAGGSIRVICLGGNQFKVEVTKYRDATGVPMQAGTLIIEPLAGGPTQTLSLSMISSTLALPQPITNPCLVPAPHLNLLEEYVYQSGNLTLSGGTGYRLYHVDVDRNSTNTIPTQVPMALYAEIPDPNLYSCNNSPVFNEGPPNKVCENVALSYDGSATDPDGDVLKYRLCEALTGNNPPFTTAPYALGYSGGYPVSANLSLAIDSNSGTVTCTPNQKGGYKGLWTFDYCVEEYRNGVKIGEYNRELQMIVTDCIPATANIGTDYTSIALGLDVIASCDDYAVKFKNTSKGGGSYFWDFGVPGIDTDTSSQFEPTYTYPDTGTFTVKLVINQGDTCADSIVKKVIVYPTITPAFSYSIPACQNSPTSFTDQSTMTYGTPIFWYWEFGNGVSSNLQNPTHKYPFGGNYNARLIFESSKGCRDTVYDLVEVGSISLDLGPDTVICGGQHILDAGNPALSVTWSTGEQTQQITVMSSGTYSITATDGTCTVEDSVEVTLDTAPTLTLDPTMNICLGDTAYPQASSSGIAFQWTPGTGVLCDTCLQTGLFPTQTTTYTFTATSGAGCEVSDTIRVEVDGSGNAEIAGNIQTSQGSPYQNGKVLLIDYNPLDSTVTAIDSTLTDGQGNFAFFTGQQQVYIKATPDSATYPNEIPTYYESGLVWDSADAITVQPCDSLFLSFSTIGGTNPGGPGFIAGNVFQGAGKMMDRSDPIEGLILILLDEVGNPVDITTTDQEGHYRFGSLALGHYSIWADKPFMRNNAAPEVELTSIDPTVDSLWIKYYDRQLFLDITAIPPTSETKTFSIYPNPGNSILFIESPYQERSELEIAVVNAVGQVMLTRFTTERTTKLDIQQLSQGMYFIQISHEGVRLTYPVVVSR